MVEFIRDNLLAICSILLNVVLLIFLFIKRKLRIKIIRLFGIELELWIGGSSKDIKLIALNESHEFTQYFKTKIETALIYGFLPKPLRQSDETYKYWNSSFSGFEFVKKVN